jgi:hypothetical protein
LGRVGLATELAAELADARMTLSDVAQSVVRRAAALLARSGHSPLRRSFSSSFMALSYCTAP